MGLFSSAPVAVEPKLSSVLIGGKPADLKRVAKAQPAILEALRPGEQLIFVVASDDSIGSNVWALTDQRLLQVSGRKLDYDLPLSKIAETRIKYIAMSNHRDVRYFCNVYWRPGPFRAVSGFVNTNGFLMLERFNGEDEIQRIVSLIDARLM